MSDSQRLFYDIPVGHKHYPFVLSSSEKCVAEAKQYPNVCDCPFGGDYRVQYIGLPVVPKEVCNKCDKYCRFRLQQQDECRSWLRKLDNLDYEHDTKRNQRLQNCGEWVRPDGKVYLKHTPATCNYGLRR